PAAGGPGGGGDRSGRGGSGRAAAGGAAMSGRLRTPALLVAGVLALAALAWQTSEYARESWWSSQPHAALEAGADLQGFTATSAEVSRLDSVRTWEGPWRAPEGFQLWSVSLAVQTQQSEIYTVSVYL